VENIIIEYENSIGKFKGTLDSARENIAEFEEKSGTG
jgi:hypothetical protein